MTNIDEITNNTSNQIIDKSDARVNPYVITDAIAASVLIDGVTITTLLTVPLLTIGAASIASPFILPIIGVNTASALYTALSGVFPIVTNSQEFIFTAAVSIAGGFTTYIIRDYTRADFKDAGLDSFNGVLGGGVKYAGSEIANQLYKSNDLSFSKIAIKTALGAGNNYAYEKCSANYECSSSNYNIVKIEFGEAVTYTLGSYLYNSNFAQNTESKTESTVFNNHASSMYQLISGYIVGEIVKLSYENVFAPNIDSIHRISDVICEEFPSLIIAKDKISDSFAFASESISSSVGAMHDLYNYTYSNYIGASDSQEL